MVKSVFLYGTLGANHVDWPHMPNKHPHKMSSNQKVALAATAGGLDVDSQAGAGESIHTTPTPWMADENAKKDRNANPKKQQMHRLFGVFDSLPSHQ